MNWRCWFGHSYAKSYPDTGGIRLTCRRCADVVNFTFPTPPKPRSPVFVKLSRLTQQPNWDLEGGEVISEAQWQIAERFYAKVKVAQGNQWKAPYVSPCGDGSIHMTWVLPKRRLNLEIQGDVFYVATRCCSGGEYTHFIRHGADEALCLVTELLERNP